MPPSELSIGYSVLQIRNNFIDSGILSGLCDYSDEFVSDIYDLLKLCEKIIENDLPFAVNTQYHRALASQVIRNTLERQGHDWDLFVFGISAASSVMIEMSGISPAVIAFAGERSAPRTVYSDEPSILRLLQAQAARHYAISRTGAEKILAYCMPLRTFSNSSNYTSDTGIINFITSGNYKILNSFFSLPPLVIN